MMFDIGADLQRAYDEGYRKGKEDEHRWWSTFCANCKTENSSEKPNNSTTEDCSTVWTKENCKGCKYNEYPYDSGTCFVRVCINGNKYEPKDEPQTEEWYTVQDEQEYNDRWSE